MANEVEIEDGCNSVVTRSSVIQLFEAYYSEGSEFEHDSGLLTDDDHVVVFLSKANSVTQVGVLNTVIRTSFAGPSLITELKR